MGAEAIDELKTLLKLGESFANLSNPMILHQPD